MGFADQAPFHWFSQSVLLWVKRAALQLNPGIFLLDCFLLFLIIFHHMFQEAILGY